MSLLTLTKGLLPRRWRGLATGESPHGIVSAIACIGIALTLTPSNQILKRTGAALALTASGAALANVVQKNSVEEAEHTQAKSHLAELKQLQAQYEQRESSLKTFLDMAMTDAESFKRQITQMHEVLADDQLEKASIFRELQVAEKEHQHTLYDLREMAIAQGTASIQLDNLRASSRLEIDQIQTTANTRINELETTLAEKTNMAAQMLSELEAEATNTFNQFNAKVTAQCELIEKLHRRIESLRNENTALVNQQTRSQLDRQIGSIRANNTVGNDVFNSPA